jgi:hypothetical protein
MRWYGAVRATSVRCVHGKKKNQRVGENAVLVSVRAAVAPPPSGASSSRPHLQRIVGDENQVSAKRRYGCFWRVAVHPVAHVVSLACWSTHTHPSQRAGSPLNVGRSSHQRPSSVSNARPHGSTRVRNGASISCGGGGGGGCSSGSGRVQVRPGPLPAHVCVSFYPARFSR